jgi:hypothetical protein
VGTGSDNITADNTPPTPATALVAKTVSPGGHQNVALSWTAGTDANYRGVVLRYNAWSYPEYPTAGTPVYPATPTAGTGVGPTPITGTSTVHSIAARNVYYYSVFAVDWAGNSALLDGTGTDRTANYYLGDLGSGTGTYIPGSGGYNGRVNYDDLFWFSRLYISTAPGWTALDPNAAEADFGPTVANKAYPANSRFGVPRPDGRVDFEDLVIFSINYNVVAPKIEAPEGVLPAAALAVELRGNAVMVQTGGRFEVAVHLANDGQAIKATSVVLRYDPAWLVLDEVGAAGVFGVGQQAFLAHQEGEGMVRIDAAILGTGRALEFSSDLAIVRFRALHSGEARVTLESATIRGADNEDLEPSLGNHPSELPETFLLAQNYPNPFNPATIIGYSLPEPSHVVLRVYNTLGQEVATLVDEPQPAGYKSVTWHAGSLASGVYFYRLMAGKSSDLKRMLLVR